MDIARALSIAGSDSGGGAGIQADIKTFTTLGVYGASVISALTAQNTCGVQSVEEIPPDFITKQINSVCQDIRIDSIKTGMLANKQIVRAVAQAVKKFSLHPFVLDPVMVAQSGDRLLLDDAVDEIKTHLLPLADIITPNIPEAAMLLQTDFKYVQENPWKAAAELLSIMNQGEGNTTLTHAVLIKGGHAFSTEVGSVKPDIIKDYFLTKNTKKILEKPRIQTLNTHGTGCTLSAAICAYLASKHPLEQAVELADKYLQGAIKSAVDIKLGGRDLNNQSHKQSRGPVHHFYKIARYD